MKIKTIVVLCTILATFVCNSLAGDKFKIYSKIQSILNTKAGFQVEVLVVNNSDSVIYLDSNLVPFSYTLSRLDEGLENRISGGAKDRFTAHGRTLNKDRLIKVKSNQEHSFVFAIASGSRPLHGRIEFQLNFNCYNENEIIQKQIISKNIVEVN